MAAAGDPSMLDVSGRRLRSLLEVDVTDRQATEVSTLDASGNVVRTVSGLERFPSLLEVNLAQNRVDAVGDDDWTAIAHSCGRLASVFLADNQLTAFSARPLTALTTIDLSGNLLVDLPQLASCRALTTLALHDNRISHLEHIPATLPPSIRVLTLHNNKVADWHDCLELLHLTDSLEELSLRRNPLVQRAAADGFNLAMFVSCCLPALLSLDGTDIADSTGDVDACAVLDRIGSGGHDRDSVLRILQAHCRVGGGERTSHEAVSPLPGLTRRSRRSTERSVSQPRSESSTAGFVPAKEFNELSDKVRIVTAAVHVLRQADLRRRRAAGLRILSFLRMAVVRLGLLRTYRRAPRHWRLLQRDWQRRTQTALVAVAGADGRIDEISKASRQMWAELAHFRGVIRVTQRAAARKIVSWWRVASAQRRYRYLRKCYTEFTQPFVPHAVTLQRFLYVVSARREMAQRVKQRRFDEMEAEVSYLRAEVADLRSMMAQVLAATQPVGGQKRQEAAVRAALSTDPSPRSLEPTPSDAYSPPGAVEADEVVEHRLQQEDARAAPVREDSLYTGTAGSGSRGRTTSAASRSPDPATPVFVSHRAPPPVPSTASDTAPLDIREAALGGATGLLRRIGTEAHDPKSWRRYAHSEATQSSVDPSVVDVSKISYRIGSHAPSPDRQLTSAVVGVAEMDL